jgi:Fe2+ transport system protein FeoA
MAVVQRVENENPDLLRYLSSIGLTPQARLEVVDVSEFDGNLHLIVGNQRLVLGPAVTHHVFVEVV